MTQQPDDLGRLQDELMALATFGGLSDESPFCDWYEAVGIAGRDHHGKGVLVIPDWGEQTCPAVDDEDLVRRSLLRDPEYRLHVDIVVASTLQVIGKTERWYRLEELLEGRLRSFCPRFLSLLEWQMQRTGRSAAELTTEDWQGIDRFAQHESQLTRTWDSKLWRSDRPSQCFPILEQRYPGIRHLPVCANFPDDDGALRNTACQLVSAAACGEGIVVQSENSALLDELRERGMPLLAKPHGQHQWVAGIVAPVVVVSDKPRPDGAHSPSLVLPEVSRRSRHVAIPRAGSEGDFWTVTQGSLDVSACMGIPVTATMWPADAADFPYEPRRLPVRDELEQVPRPRSTSPEVDDALRYVAAHPVTGFWLQLLLLESLDRELGEESLILAPPVDQRVDDIEAETRILYRPRQTTEVESEMATLGQLNPVLDRVSKAVGLSILPPAIQGVAGVWSHTLRMMRTAHLVKDRYDRWILHPDLFDRLHGGGLMRDVIRRGKEFRDGSLHAVLKGLWDECRSSVEVAHA